jgi:hypothetical protein
LGLTAQSMLNLLGVTTTYNAAHALSREVDLSGRQRLNRIAYIDYSYDLASTTQSGISDAILQANPTVINGAQIYGIPLHQAIVDARPLRLRQRRFAPLDLRERRERARRSAPRDAYRCRAICEAHRALETAALRE